MEEKIKKLIKEYNAKISATNEFLNDMSMLDINQIHALRTRINYLKGFREDLEKLLTEK